MSDEIVFDPDIIANEQLDSELWFDVAPIRCLRPTTTVAELSALPQMADPASKMAMHQRKTHLGE